MKRYFRAFLFAFLITAVFYISLSLIKSNHIAYATGFVFCLALTLIFKKQSKSSKAAELLNKHVKEWAVRESRRAGLLAPDQDTKDLESCKKRFKDSPVSMKVEWSKKDE
ncbi:TPA: hypothetical protein NES15_001293 [Acinetobacter baumannii]|uniref:hypothetical protein n=1 Tax=Acinetobacter baumannii TaxID=470 RepID=UPI00056EFC4C|nr:hypothetical protein [Acinetobacter baumannii]MCJ9277277.1 hypothetical protein [Acinetobacter baumannii]OYN08889.1 hypothetical protein CI653_07325 [Acinetobacter baumannii]SSI27169.1 Uncharacterised protein [Acinetobacter baumannii]SSN39566.1 Uncharacterised protein [Acinetobacter baumannii]SSO43991.1 Uncharacterised protein [Acinetobacter baumannii]